MQPRVLNRIRIWILYSLQNVLALVFFTKPYFPEILQIIPSAFPLEFYHCS